MSVWKACPVPLDLHIPAFTSGKRSLAYRYVSVVPFILHGPGFQFLNDESSLLLIHHYEHLIPFHERERTLARNIGGFLEDAMTWISFKPEICKQEQAKVRS